MELKYCLVILCISCSSHVFGRLTVDPEVFMNTTELIRYQGYPCIDYDVQTKDGYILDIQRIPYGRKGSNSTAIRPVVFLQHGLLSCSACWVENLANESLGFILADAGFDVWLGNSRGNTYGRRHVKLNPDQKEFWSFSWDEMAKYDLPATVDKILEVTKADQLFYVGHSQGGGIGFAQLSQDPDFASKIKMFIPLAPAVYLGNLRSPLRLLAPFSRDLDFIYSLFGNGEILPYDSIYQWLAKDICDREIPAYLCKNFLFILCGFDEQQINNTRVPVYIGQHPAGTSVQNLNHFAQMVDSGKFQMYDFGPEENKKKYNQTTPPEYHPSKVTVPTALFSGTEDWLVVPKDVTKLRSELTSLIYNKVINGWEHLDFIWALDAPSESYNQIVKLLKGV